MAKKPAQRVTAPVGALDEIKIPPESEYDALMALNLFSPERTEIVPGEKTKQLSAGEKKNIQLNLKKLILHGLVITDDSAEALVSHLVAKPVLKRGAIRNARLIKQRPTVKRAKWVKVHRGGSAGKRQTSCSFGTEKGG
ncbi:MAG: hypothetical protein JRD04_03810 [Deltaproteobacteria bacterium]|nr:hypothetical protein [Deltaproteobacteria bacterium]